LEVISAGLTELGVTHDVCILHVLDGHKPKSAGWAHGRLEWTLSATTDRLQHLFESASKPLCQPDLMPEDPCDESSWARERTPPIRCIADAAWSRGVLSIGSSAPYAFQPLAVKMLGVLASVLSESFLPTDAVGKQSEQNLLKERMSACAQLAAGISHNLNNMLTGVLLPAQSLLRWSSDPVMVREAAETITRAGMRARNLLRRLDDAVRPQNDGVAQAVDVNRRVWESVELAKTRWRDEAETRGISIEMITELGEVSPVSGDPAQFSDLVLSLLFNAIDAMPEGGTITVSTCATQDDVVCLTVSDTGVGMDEGIRRHVFEPLFTTKVDVGSGLGLSTAYGTVVRSGGTMEVESEVGRGTTFTIRLPAFGNGEEKRAEVVADKSEKQRCLQVSDMSVS
jgi:signal transduction histidine kinase